MKASKSNAVIAIAAMVAAVLMALALSFAIGKWSLNGNMHTFTVIFPSASGISESSEVKLAGAPIGRVKSVNLIPLEQQQQDPASKLYNSVAVIVEVNPSAQVQEGSSVTIKQDGIGLSPQYLFIMPSKNHLANLLENGATMQGQMPQDLTSLVQTAGDTMMKADTLMDEMQPTMDQLKSLAATMNEKLPGFLTTSQQLVENLNGVMSSFSSPEDKDKLKRLITNMDTLATKGNVTLTKADALIDHLAPTVDQMKTLSESMNEQLPGLMTKTETLVDNTNGFISTVGTPEQQEKLKKLIANFVVISDSLKVVSANAQALTSTLAQTPWRIVWGGKTVQPPPAEEVLKSSKMVPINDNLSAAH